MIWHLVPKLSSWYEWDHSEIRHLNPLLPQSRARPWGWSGKLTVVGRAPHPVHLLQSSLRNGGLVRMIFIFLLLAIFNIFLCSWVNSRSTETYNYRNVIWKGRWTRPNVKFCIVHGFLPHGPCSLHVYDFHSLFQYMIVILYWLFFIFVLIFCYYSCFFRDHVSQCFWP